jgi:chromate transporter
MPDTITAVQLSRLIGTRDATVLVDVRIDNDHAADPRMIPSSFRRDYRTVSNWAGEYAGRSVVVICRWISEARFLHALNYCHLLRGPEAQQLAIYIGWLMHRAPGGLIAAVLFVVPGIIALMALSWIYVLWENFSFVAGLLFGLKAAVLAVVIEAVLRIGRRALKSRLAVVIAVAAFVALFFFAVLFPLVVLAAALTGFVADRMGYAVGGSAAHGKPDDDILGEHLPHHTRPSLARPIAVVATWLPLWIGPVVLLFLILGPDNIIQMLLACSFAGVVLQLAFGGAL